MLHELRATVDLLWANGIPPLGLFALPYCDRDKPIADPIEEQISGDQTFALEGTDMVRPLGDRGVCRSGFRPRSHNSCIHAFSSDWAYVCHHHGCKSGQCSTASTRIASGCS